MKINLSINELNKLFDIDESNKVYSEFILDYLKCAKIIAINYKNDLLSSTINFFEMNKDTLAYFKPYKMKENFSMLDVKEYESNPYNVNIKLDNITDNQYKFELLSYSPYEGFLYKDIELLNNHIEHTSIGYFNQEYKYIALSCNDDIWMLITPHEINTMKDGINNACGKVITFGLGLGYFAYMCSLKENVSSITIIEKDRNIIDLFKKYILPQFEYKNKINIIEIDAISYLKNNEFDYDYAYVDLWRDVDDGLPLYVLINKLSLKHTNTTFDYWIENSMIAVLKRLIINLIYENAYNEKYEDDSYYSFLSKKLGILLMDYEINSLKDIDNLLSQKNIKQLIMKVDL